MRRNYALLNHQLEVKRLPQELLRLKLNLILLHLRAQVSSPRFVRRDQIHDELPALLILSDDRQRCGVVKHIGESLCGEEAPADESRGWGIPEGVLFFVDSGDNSGLKVVFAHVLDDIVTVGEGLWVPPVGVASILVEDFDHN